jgi:N-acetylmuramoyl-L-alanine amidase
MEPGLSSANCGGHPADWLSGHKEFGADRQSAALPPGRVDMSGFHPDCSFVKAVYASPNHGPRRGTALDTLVLHYTGMASADAALRRLCDPAAEVSCHYLVFEDGGIYQLVAEERRAWHAGLSCWGGERDMNSVSIGIELANGGPDFGSPPFAEAQIAAVIALCRDILARRKIPPRRVLGHSDIAPSRKIDPGENFPWERLAEAGIGHCVAAAAITAGASLQRGSRGADVEELQERLSHYGYDVAVTGLYDEQTEVVVKAFQRHFRPVRVDGQADRSTLATLEALLAGLPRA